MKYVIEPAPSKNEWVVEIYDEGRDGGLCLATFSGRRAVTHAFEYVTWKYAKDKAAVTA